MNERRWVRADIHGDLWKAVRRRMLDEGLTWSEALSEAFREWVRVEPAETNTNVRE